MINQKLFHIGYLTHTVLVDFRVFHIGFSAFVLLNILSFFSFSVHKIFNAFLHRGTLKTSIFAFSVLSIVQVYFLYLCIKLRFL